MKGIAKAKAALAYNGRPKSIESQQVREWKAKGLGVTEIAQQMGIGRASVYQALGEYPPSGRPRRH